MSIDSSKTEKENKKNPPQSNLLHARVAGITQYI